MGASGWLGSSSHIPTEYTRCIRRCHARRDRLPAAPQPPSPLHYRPGSLLTDGLTFFAVIAGLGLLGWLLRFVRAEFAA